MTTQPEALRLAELLEKFPMSYADEAAAELRRLHEANNSLSRVTLRISDEFQARIAALETALKQAVEALEQSNRFVWHYADNERTARMAQACDDAIAVARQTLGGAA